MSKLLVEALVVAVATVIVGVAVSYGVMYYKNPESVVGFQHWGGVAVSYFITGFLIHLVAEYSGVNKWYCSNGVACQ